MDFENFNQARDYYYLAAMLLGAGIGCILYRFRKKSTSKTRNWAIVAGLCFFSLAFAALTVAIIYSNGLILLAGPLYPYLGVLAILLVLAFRFPRAAGFPLILVCGVFIVWISYGYLRFPLINDTGRMRITRESNGIIHVIPAANNGEKSIPVLSFQSTGNGQAMEFRAFCISFSKLLPYIGGVKRGDIAEIRCGDELLYSDPRFSSKFFPSLYTGVDNTLFARRFFTIKEIPAKLELKRLKAGEGLTVFLRAAGNEASGLSGAEMSGRSSAETPGRFSLEFR